MEIAAAAAAVAGPGTVPTETAVEAAASVSRVSPAAARAVARVRAALVAAVARVLDRPVAAEDGYSGGGGGGSFGAGGGGGSFITDDATNPLALGGQHSGAGVVSFDLQVAPTPAPEPGSALLIMSALIGLRVSRRGRHQSMIASS